MEWLSGFPTELTLPGFAILVCLLIVTGAIPTRRELRDSQAREAKAMELADGWQKVATEQGMTLNRVLDVVEDINTVVTAIQTGLQRGTEQ